ncbi:MAG: hypothetical protein ABGX24_01680 [Aquificota bacterium]|jgi:hypothetical protein
MNFWWFLLTVIFILWAFLLWIQLGWVALISPEVAVIILTALGFGIFAFRLLANYVFVINAADALKENQEVDKQKLAQKSGKTEEEVSQIHPALVLELILTALEPYRYTFYFGFMLTLILAVAFGILPGINPIKDIFEAIFWGSALTTFLVWAFENFATSAVAELIENLSEEELSPNVPQQEQNQQNQG